MTKQEYINEIQQMLEQTQHFLGKSTLKQPFDSWKKDELWTLYQYLLAEKQCKQMWIEMYSKNLIKHNEFLIPGFIKKF